MTTRRLSEKEKTWHDLLHEALKLAEEDGWYMKADLIIENRTPESITDPSYGYKYGFPFYTFYGPDFSRLGK